MAKPAVPYGWTTTIAVCNNCAAYPTTVTLTKPVETYPGGPVTTATIYATRVLTVTVHNSASYSTEVYPVYTTTYPIGKPVPAGPDSNVPSAPVKPAYVSSVPGKAAVVSSVPYGSLPAVSVVNGGAAPGYPSPSFASSVNVKPVVTAGHGAAGTGTPANAAPYAKFTGAGVKESVSVVALFSALLFAIIL
ncbi:MAG: putative glycosyl family protein [Rhizobacter sp.]|nr:putative glycosyl family protein [Rhizobacter sp.]